VSEVVTPKQSKWGDLALRATSGIILALLAAATDFAGGWIFRIVVVLAGVQILREWLHMTQSRGAHYPLMAIGFIYATATVAALLYLREMPDGAAFIGFLVSLVIATDVGAYFVGRIVGGPKLSPRFSPNKTWAGLLGGMACAALVFIIARKYVNITISWPWAILFGAMIAVLAQIGDLCESGLKRHFDFKDSGTIIPGHGGLMDRVDGLVPVVVVAASFIWASS
jgi:phosphatidate cytidylyltransferase